MDAIDEATRTELEAAAFRRLVEHLRARGDVQNIDLMNLAGFCRNCLSNWYQEAAAAAGLSLGKDEARAASLQSDAIELSMLLTIPAAVALAICAEPFVTMIFQGGRFALSDAAITGKVLAALVLGLPAYVLVKVLVPNFYARADTKTPVIAAFVSLGVFIAFCIANLGLSIGGPIDLWLFSIPFPHIELTAVHRSSVVQDESIVSINPLDL